MTYDRTEFLALIDTGMPTAEAARRVGVTERTAYRWAGRRKPPRSPDVPCATCGSPIRPWATFCSSSCFGVAQKLPIMDRLFGKATYDPDTGCLLYGGGHVHGYSILQVNGTTTTAHRASYRIMVGEPPNGYEIDHLCRVRNCIQPSHLEAVTKAENIRRSRLNPP